LTKALLNIVLCGDCWIKILEQLGYAESPDFIDLPMSLLLQY